MIGPMEAVAALRDVLVREHVQAPGLFREIARMEELLADTYRDRVPYELLQNSDDAGSQSVLVEDLGENRFRWSNDGRPLNAADIEALCRSASSTKSRGGDSIGYRGIGFKSLAAIAQRIDVRSAGVRFAFDRTAAASLLGEPDTNTVPLIRIPAEVHTDTPIDGVAFTVTCRPNIAGALRAIDPLSALFLRNVTRIRTSTATARQDMLIERDTSRVVLRLDEDEAAFGLLRHGAATVAVPLDARALAMTGVRGRLACFLPLQDEVGLPVIVSGDILTDPSRTHAVTADESTRRVLSDAARVIAERLRSPGDPIFERLWQLLLEGEDLRGVMVSATASAEGVLDRAETELAFAGGVLGDVGEPQLVRTGGGEVTADQVVVHRRAGLAALAALLAEHAPPAVVPADPPCSPVRHSRPRRRALRRPGSGSRTPGRHGARRTARSRDTPPPARHRSPAGPASGSRAVWRASAPGTRP